MDTTIPEGYCHCGCGQWVGFYARTNNALGMRKGEPKQFINGHHNYRPDYREDPKTDCWIWQKVLNGWGYGQLWSKEHQTMRHAHRVYYERKHGPIPAGMHLHHTCEVPACVNPDHLQPLTPKAHSRLSKSFKLSERKAKRIRELYATGDYTQWDLARMYGVGQAAISKVLLGATWT